MIKQVYEIDENGYIKEIYVAEFDEQDKCVEELEENVIVVTKPDGLYRAKWTGTEWIDDMQQKGIDELNNQPSLPTAEERVNMLENMILMMMEG